jgi:ribosomal protein L11 methyltransferase
MEAGALSVSIEDRDAGTEAEQPQFGEPGLDDPKAWQRNWVVALLEADADVPALIAAWACRLTSNMKSKPCPSRTGCA